MNAETERDPFLSIAKLCQPTASQEAKFPNCPFARESEITTNISSEQLSSSPDPTPSEPAGIVMVTPPGSTSSAHQQPEEDAVFHTPPEHHLPTYFSSEDRNLDDISSDGGSSSGRSKRARVREVGFDDDLDYERNRLRGEEFEESELVLDETEVIVDENEGVHDDTEVIVSETPGCGEKMSALDLVVRKACELSKDGVPGVSCIDGNRRSGNGCESVEDVHANKGNTNRHHEGSFYSVKSKEKTSEVKSNGGTERRHESGVGGSGKVSKEKKKSIEKIDEFRYVGGVGSRVRWMHKTGGAAADSGSGRRRQLPVSLEGEGKKAGEKAVDLKSGVLNSLDVVKVLVGYMDGECEDIDLLGIAKKRGLTFPRPRWWPDEGDDE